jgi:hypothetical protein
MGMMPTVLAAQPAAARTYPWCAVDMQEGT